MAVFFYKSVGLHHYAYVVAETETTYIIDEANYHTCRQGRREISKSDPSLLGFYTP